MVQFSASPIRTADSRAFSLRTGSAPGSPRQTGQTWVLGAAPKTVEQPQNIFVTVLSSTCTSSPSTGSKAATASSNGRTVSGTVVVTGTPPEWRAGGSGRGAVRPSAG